MCLHERTSRPAGTCWRHEGRIEQSQKVLLVLSEDFVQLPGASGGRPVGSCLERKPVLPVLLRLCRVPLHLSHLTYLEATDGRFSSRSWCSSQVHPQPAPGEPPGPALGPRLYSGKALLTLDCINRDSLSSGRCGQLQHA